MVVFFEFKNRNNFVKRRQYEQKVLDVKHGLCMTLVFTSTGSMGPAAMTIYKQIDKSHCRKEKAPHNCTYAHIRMSVAFLLLCSAICCLRGNCIRPSVWLNIALVDLVAAGARL